MYKSGQSELVSEFHRLIRSEFHRLRDCYGCLTFNFDGKSPLTFLRAALKSLLREKKRNNLAYLILISSLPRVGLVIFF